MPLGGVAELGVWCPFRHPPRDRRPQQDKADLFRTHTPLTTIFTPRQPRSTSACADTPGPAHCSQHRMTDQTAKHPALPHNAGIAITLGAWVSPLQVNSGIPVGRRRLRPGTFPLAARRRDLTPQRQKVPGAPLTIYALDAPAAAADWHLLVIICRTPEMPGADGATKSASSLPGKALTGTGSKTQRPKTQDPRPKTPALTEI